MIGIFSKPSETRAVEELFECFKTPWEFYVPDRIYDVILTTRDDLPNGPRPKLLIVCSSKPTQADKESGIVATDSIQDGTWVEWGEHVFPLYGRVLMFQAPGHSVVTRKESGKTIGANIEEHRTVRFGFDLFAEVSFLLSQGQPSENAHVPTLDIHIALLRAAILAGGISFIEVPPVPPGYDFAVCLTHDVDFVGIRDHKLDHTMWGFVYRCFFVSLKRSLTDTLPWSKCFQNWRAGLSLPLVYLGLRDDFWLEFERYLHIEKGLGSTFFFIPYKNVAGRYESTSAPKRRAAKYDLLSITEQVSELVKNNCEIGLHGIDAWLDSESARAELLRIRQVIPEEPVGVRMHWLYWAKESPKTLEDAGLAYDSTFGYNEAVGFRAGTTQPFCPPIASDFLELPLNIQDTALFYSGRMKLSEKEALAACRRLIEENYLYGGVLTVNWHTRSLSPERLWGEFYNALLGELGHYRVWFSTARKVTDWFRLRRKLRFEAVQFSENSVRVSMSGPVIDDSLPFTIKVFVPQRESRLSTRVGASPTNSPVADVIWTGEDQLEVGF